jgi:hypothetical protein
MVQPKDKFSIFYYNMPVCGATTLAIMTFSITTFSITTFSITTFTIIAFSMMTLSRISQYADLCRVS